MPVVNIHNTTVHYQEMNRGAAETVVLVHGMMSNLSVFYFNIAPLLATQYHVVMYDLKGHGLSSKSTEGYNLQTMAQELIALLDALHLQRVHLAGYSFGGLIALKTAILYPQRIGQLAIIEAPDPSDQDTLARFEAYSKSTLTDLIDQATRAQGRQLSKRQLERNYSTYEFFLKRTSVKADMQKEKDFFSDTAISDIPHTTLLLYGIDSNCNHAGPYLHRQIKTSKLAWINGDHQLPVQHPAVVAHTLNDFFAKKPSSVPELHFHPTHNVYAYSQLPV